MKTTQKLKSILQKDDTNEGFKNFNQILRSDPQIHSDQKNLLLRWAVLYEKKQFAQYFKLLCQFGVDVNFVDTKEKKSNLMIACEKKREQIVQILVNDKRTNLMLQDVRNKTALSYAIGNKLKSSSQKFVKILIKKCPQLMTKDYKKNNPLIQAINCNKLQVVRTLIQQGFNFNEPYDTNETTPLHQVFRLLKSYKNKSGYSNILQIAQIMLQKGADPYKNNKQGKNCFDFADRYGQELQQMYKQIKNKSQLSNRVQDQIEQITPIIKINTPDQREQVFNDAQKIFHKYKQTIEPTIIKKKVEPVIQQTFQQQDEGYTDDPFQPSQNFVNRLTLQIQTYANQCIYDYNNAHKELQDFINYLTPITNQLGFAIQIYGSYATGLWINTCDIDLLLVPFRQMYPQKNLWQYLQYINQKLKGTIYQKTIIMRTLSIPLMRIQIGEQKDYRKSRRIDLTILSPNNNGKQHAEYAKRLIELFPKIRPLFFVIKKLTHYYKLYDPMKSGVRSFALFLMFVIFMQQTNSENLGDLLLRFLHKFGYVCDYQYEDSTGRSMMLNLPDPISNKNNLGKRTDAFALQRMFKTAYLILHTRDIENKLQYLFQSRQMFYQKY